jgi:exonuclease SbcD
VRLLHTSDWHVGKSARGRSRMDEQAEVLAEIVGVARDRRVDVVLLVGDVFDSAAPPPEAQRLAWRTLLDLRATGAEVVVLAGNHDNAAVFEALRPLAAGAGISLLGRPARPEAGGVVSFERGGEKVRIALLPFCSQRGIVRSAELLAGDAATNAGIYAERVAEVLAHLTSGFSPDAVNVVAAHVMARGGRLGGGERDAQTVEDYWVDATAFGTSAHYVALGHLHLAQQLPAGCPVWYSGSPFQVDFGEEGDDKHVLLVEATPGRPAPEPERVVLRSPRRLRTIRGTLDELRPLAATTGDDLLRVYVREMARAGLADEVRELFEGAVDVLLERDPETAGAGSSAAAGSGPRTAHELFAAYLAGRGVADERVERLFARLLDEETA